MDTFDDDESFVDDPEEVSVSLNESALVFLDDSVFTEASSFSSEKDSSFSLAVVEGEPVTSTPQKVRRSGRSKNDSNNNSSSTFKAPTAPKPKKQVFATCPRCRAELKTPQTFENHTLSHRWKDLASKIPNDKELKEYCKEAFGPLLKKLGEESFAGSGGEEFKKYVQEFSTKEETDQFNAFVAKLADIVVKGVTGVSIQKRPVTFIQTIRKFVIEHINASLNLVEVQDDLIEAALRVKVCVVDIVYPFVFQVLRSLGNSVMKHMFISMSGRDPQATSAPKVRSKDDFNVLRTQQIVHYISGSCMKGIVRHAYVHPKSEKLHRRKMCVTRRFGAFGQQEPSGPRDTSYWTSILNRKSLFFVREDVLPFFLHLAAIIQRMEKPDGSLGHEEVMEEVARDLTALSLWSEIIDTELDDEESFDLLIKVVRSLTNTYGRGTLMRRMNKRWKTGKGNKGTISVSHRAKLL